MSTTNIQAYFFREFVTEAESWIELSPFFLLFSRLVWFTSLILMPFLSSAKVKPSKENQLRVILDNRNRFAQDSMIRAGNLHNPLWSPCVIPSLKCSLKIHSMLRRWITPGTIKSSELSCSQTRNSFLQDLGTSSLLLTSSF